MRIPAQPFFNFCSKHVPLLRALAEHQGELSEGTTRSLIRTTSEPNDERPDTTWQRLLDFQILIPAEADSDQYVMARPVSSLVAYLFDEAHAATPEIISGYIRSIEALNKRLSLTIDEDSISGMRLFLDELQQTLQRIHADLDETYRSVTAEVAAFKSRSPHAKMQERFRRIVYWMERYIDPMVDVIRPDGPLTAVFQETERLLRRAREHSMFNDVPRLELNSRRIRLVQRRALHIFQQCRHELRPLYESLRRSSFIAQGAAIALERLQRDGLRNNWTRRHVVPVQTLQIRQVPSDGAIKRCIQSLVDYSPEPPPRVDLDPEDEVPEDLIRQQWLLALPDTIRPDLPIPDLLEWLTSRYPDKATSDVLDAFTYLVYNAQFSAQFTDGSSTNHRTADALLSASPTELRNV